MNIDQFKRVFDDILLIELEDHLNNLDLSDEAVTWFVENFTWNVPGGKMFRGMTVVECVSRLMPKDNEHLLEKAAILGWLLETLQAFFLVVDDIMDKGEMRRGQVAWYRREGVGNIAINDALLLESYIYRMLKVHFGSHPHYSKLLDLFHEVSYYTECGQLMDSIHSQTIESFDKARYEKITKMKTAYYSFYLPIASGIVLCEKHTASGHVLNALKEICVKLGHLFQVQDDFLDCYGMDTGKGGFSDICSGKCTWLIVTALEKANDEQLAILNENYGVPVVNNRERIIAVYNELGIKDMCIEWQNDIIEEIEAAIAEFVDVDNSILTWILNKIRSRQK
ncbi:hypothetical protein PCE1_000080 [Barthelona sp. PCE]